MKLHKQLVDYIVSVQNLRTFFHQKISINQRVASIKKEAKSKADILDLASDQIVVLLSLPVVIELVCPHMGPPRELCASIL